MSAALTPPFPRGTTWGATTTTDGRQIEGTEWLFPDVNPSTGAHRSYSLVRCRAVRNVSASTIAGKRIAQMSTGTFTRVSGYAQVLGGRGYPTDEYLPSAGVPTSDIFWVVVDGPAIVTTAVEANMAIAVTTGDTQQNPTWFVAQTSAASNSTTAGRVIPQMAAFTATTQATTNNMTLVADNIQNRIGWAMTAGGSTLTGSDMLIMVRQF